MLLKKCQEPGAEYFTQALVRFNCNASIFSNVRAGYQLTDTEVPGTNQAGEGKWFMNNLKGMIEKDCLASIWGSQFDIPKHKQAEENREKLINELQKGSKEIKTLKGILPFCSFCKKIRDDKGYWEKVDVYIHKHSKADIRHGICPECAKEHYPDLNLYQD